MVAETEILAGFDYGPDVDADTRHSLEMIAAELELEVTNVVKRIVVIGRKLAIARDKCERVNGGFRAWVHDRCGFSQAWAYSAIQVVEKLGECPTVGHLTVRALFDLVRDNVPDSAREEVTARAKAGEKIDNATAAEIVDRHKANSKPVRTIRMDYDDPIHEGEQEFKYDEPRAADEPEPEQPAPLFAHMASLPPDVSDAHEAYKLAIMRHKFAGWAEISREDMLDSLGRLAELARRPADVA